MMKLGIALSGGGIRGVAHAGVLKALDENGITISAIGGTSSGSIVATLYAIGYSPYYIYILLKKYAQELVNSNAVPLITSFGNFMSNKKVQFSGLYTGEEIETNFNNVVLRKGIKKISDIKMPLVIPTVDVNDSKEYIFTNRNPSNNPNSKEEKGKYITDIKVGKAVRASSSFPVFFSPCEFKNHKFIDGGILNNVPVKEVRKQGVDNVIAVNFKADDVTSNSSIMDIAMRSIDIMGNEISVENINDSDYLLTIQTDKTGLLEVDKLDECYEYGYKQTINKMEQIKKIISN